MLCLKNREAMRKREVSKAHEANEMIHDHVPVQIVEEAQQVEAQLNKRLFLMQGQSSEDLCCVQEVSACSVALYVVR